MTAYVGNEAEEYEGLLALLHRLDTEYRRMQADVDAMANDSIRAGKNLAEVVLEMSRRSEELRASHQPLVDALNGALLDLCEIYLRARRDVRARIRNAFSGHRTLLVHLINLSGTAALSMSQGDPSNWMWLGLAALSIEDNRTDYRDTCVAVEYLYSAAAKAGLEPRPYFHQIAALSSNTMHGFLSGIARRST